MSDNWRDHDSGEHRSTRGRVFNNRSFSHNRGGQRQNRPDRYNNYNSFNNTDTEDWGDSWSHVDKKLTPKSNYNRREATADDVNVVITVPSEKVGRIIGRGGGKIRELQDESQAEIKVLKDSEEFGMTKIKLTGSKSSTQKADELIQNLIADRPPPFSQSNGSSNSWQNDSQESEEPPTSFNWQEMNRICEEETKAFWAKLPDIIKDFYVEDPQVASMSARKAQQIREANNNTTVSYVFPDKGHVRKIPNPIETFQQCFKHYPEILQNLLNMAFERPSPIQASAWPVLLSGMDLIGIAQTGTGKTLAFLLPALIHIEGQTTPRSERSGPTVLVMAPTRELAQQIEKEVLKYNYRDIKAICLYGGGNRRQQAALCAGVEIVIATPGRLSDLTCAGHIDLKSVSYLVLDEADRMLDLGFEPQIRKILLDIRPNRQTVMTSATWPPGVRRLAEAYTQDPVQVCVGTLDLAAVHSVTQTISILEDNDQVKFNELLMFLTSMDEDCKVIVFCGKKTRVDNLSSDLALKGIACQTIHGDLEQVDREQALMDIASGQVQILIATDVASRGIDIRDITHVINYDFPRNVEEYVHRVGRTGRAGRTGESISFVTRADWANAKELISILEEANQSIPSELYDMSTRFEAFQEKRQKERDVLRGNRPGGGGGRRGGGFRNNSRW